ncbi:class I lanthipeptide [Taibaiella chishuiensis]|uniref:Uncharacterized protein n=1 Tax=Taibaiella chishuiensis TaxID=1434707 RepID=A0A2P8D0K6_9BACT|nr:class I lanthipeptide [Taibaiella chishuiensis]PSK90747.1 hypothetical protein B0I18_107157 [Taibaiella chishuiensis]
MKKKTSARKLSLKKLTISELNATQGGRLLETGTIKISNYPTQCPADSFCASYLVQCFPSKECN